MNHGNDTMPRSWSAAMLLLPERLGDACEDKGRVVVLWSTRRSLVPVPAYGDRAWKSMEAFSAKRSLVR